ncbi:SEC-C metal-binding domain-containing protein [Hyalangium sp.]|uniref:SEC-C metal-binding domain-containing protein n=1 Tax=Hyalangium sp. TaxID=2028555 RepID=UPI002D6A60DC|nr:SEC-C metal-binding domain-containing protein [Hyalangium sp.]HYH99591.1 SEC-C metal-binding domain-containing protein [Hyalangium sp.]
MKPSRNARCPCGSGKKYKQCCGPAEAVRDKRKSTFAMIATAVVLVFGIGVVAVLLSRGSGSSNRIWSAEHGHWHDASGSELGLGSSNRIWSAEHNHWHDASGSELGLGSSMPSTAPAGPAPAGKVR